MTASLVAATTGFLGLALAAAMPSIAAAQCAPEPLIKQGSCPSGYYASGAYCMPTSRAKKAIAKSGSCPSGYYASGNYCVVSGNRVRQAIPKVGSCPSGWYSSGQYCLRSN